MSGKTAVVNWIADNYNLGDISMKDFPKLPGGTLVTNKKGKQLLVFFDHLNRRVMSGEPAKKKKERRKAMNIKDLLNTIQELRDRLHALTEEKDLTDPEVIRASQELDEALTHYENMIKDKNHE